VASHNTGKASPLRRRQALAAADPRSSQYQLDEPATQRHACREPLRLAALRLAANLDDDALAFVEAAAAWQHLARG